MAFLLVPGVLWIRYPFLPPGMGNGDTVLKRSFWGLFLMATCIAAFVIIELVVAKLKGRVSDNARWVLSVVAPVVVIAAIMFVFPSVGDPYPRGISAAMIWSFRIRSLGMYALYWSVVGLFGGWMVNQVATTTARAEGPLRQGIAFSSHAN